MMAKTVPDLLEQDIHKGCCTKIGRNGLLPTLSSRFPVITHVIPDMAVCMSSSLLNHLLSPKHGTRSFYYAPISAHNGYNELLVLRAARVSDVDLSAACLKCKLPSVP